MNIYIFLFYFVVASEEIFEFRIVGLEKKWKCALFLDNIKGTILEQGFGVMKEKIKSGEKLELTLKKGNGDFGSTNVEKFQNTNSGPEVDAQLGDIILGNGRIFSFILGNIKANGYKIGYIIQPSNGFESLFGSENHETNITIGILQEGTEKPKESKIRSD